MCVLGICEKLYWLPLSTSTVADYRCFSLIAKKSDGYFQEVKIRINEGESRKTRGYRSERQGTIPERSGQCNASVVCVDGRYRREQDGMDGKLQDGSRNQDRGMYKGPQLGLTNDMLYTTAMVSSTII